MQPPPDAALWARICSGEAEALSDLYVRHVRTVQSYCLWRTADLQSAEDVTASVFLEIWRRRRRLTLTADSAAPLLLGIANNLLREHWRSRRRHRDALSRIRSAAGQPPADLESEAIARIDAISQVREAGSEIRALPRPEREVLALIAWGELSYEETALALQIPIGTVRSRLSRARSRLSMASPFHQATSPVEEAP
jgi:RNA polymerase sigma factor (sigma-70 family)